MKVPLLDLKAQHAAVGDEVMAAVAAVFEEQRFILGPQVAELERQVAELCGCAPQAGVGVSSGSDALLCALMALGLGPGDEVITSPYTFFATAGAIARLGARPVFAEIDPRTYNLDPEAVAAAVTGRSRAIVAVHLFGQMAPMAPLAELARRQELHLIEDVAQAIGATQGGAPAGSLGTLGCLSFFPSKNLGGAGDGGMIVGRDPELLERARVLRAHGASPKYVHALVGGNFRLDTLQAAVLLAKLPHLSAWSEARRAHARRYDEAFAGIAEVETPVIAAENRSVYNQYVIATPLRDELQAHLGEAGIGTAIYYPLGLHQQRCFAHLGYRAGQFPHTERAARQTLALPVYPELSEAQQQHVIDAVRGFFRR